MSAARSFLVGTAALERLRIARGYTIETLAAKAVISAKTIRRALSGKRISLDNIRKIARVLNAQPQDLIAPSELTHHRVFLKGSSFSVRLLIAGRCEAVDHDLLNRLSRELASMLEAEGVTVTRHRAIVLIDSNASDEAEVRSEQA